ncbi:MAG: MFS transporter [Rhizobiales bacterium 62-17]|nr:MFS transporter [Hyphomicrobiales bacterium]OJY02079.1 MAG: MFS transporter [Rhizobiales bacterium 62-17]
MKDQHVGWGVLFSGKNGIRSVALAGGVGLHAINVYVATTILPSVVKDIGGLDYYAWNTTLFVVASILGSALSARLLQASGPRGAYTIAALIFGLGTLVCAAAPNMPVMLVGRFVQGLGGGFLFALAYAMIRIVFEEAQWPRAMALVSGMWGIATLVGPAVGGIFAEIGAWRAAFWSMLPIIALFTFLAFTVLPRKNREQSERTGLPFAQLSLLTLAVFAVSLGSIWQELIWNGVGIAVALVFLALFGIVERTARQRLLPRGAFDMTKSLGLVLAMMALLSISVTVTEIFVPLFLQVLHGQQPLAAGYITAAMAAGWTTGAIASASARDRGADRAIFLAPLISLIGMILLALLSPWPTRGEWIPLTVITLSLLTVGAGVGIGWPHLLTRVLQVAPADEKDLASASITTVQLVATALCAPIAGMVANLAGLTDPGGVIGTSSAAFWLFAVFALAPAVALLAAINIMRQRQRPAIAALPRPSQS